MAKTGNILHQVQIYHPKVTAAKYIEGPSRVHNRAANYFLQVA
jgi:hypothetical protein